MDYTTHKMQTTPGAPNRHLRYTGVREKSGAKAEAEAEAEAQADARHDGALRRTARETNIVATTWTSRMRGGEGFALSVTNLETMFPELQEREKAKGGSVRRKWGTWV